MEFEERTRPAKDEESEVAEFERRLRLAIRRHEAPLGLKSRVLSQARARRKVRHGRAWIWQRLAASVVLAALFGGAAVYRENQERRKGELAKEQVMTALRITHRTLDRVNEHLTENTH